MEENYDEREEEMKKRIDTKVLENLLWYLQNKFEDVYDGETKQAVE